jgi:hypothetical protein
VSQAAVPATTTLEEDIAEIEARLMRARARAAAEQHDMGKASRELSRMAPPVLTLWYLAQAHDVVSAQLRNREMRQAQPPQPRASGFRRREPG